MARTRQSVEDRLAALNGLDAGSDPGRDRERLEAAIGDRHHRVVAKAAGLCAERLLYDLESDLLAAYQRFLPDPSKRDPNCTAKQSIARALVDLDCNDASFFVDGLHYRQMEPGWGGSVDSAVDLRCSCAMGLVATGYPRALHELVQLLSDAEANARKGAVRAISCANPREAELLLRFKVLTGDPDPEVIAECFTALLSVEPDESPSFVARYLTDADEVIRELSALALGESRLPRALVYLQQAREKSILRGRFHIVLVRAAALHRSDAAFDWLLSMVAEADSALVEDVLEALAVYRRNATLTERIRFALEARNEQRLKDRFARLWD